MAVSRATVPQPDFLRIAEHHRGLAEELSKCSNLPAVDSGTAMQNGFATIMTEIRSMNRRIDERFDNLEREMRQGFRSMQQRIKTVDSNNIARLANSQITAHLADLSPLLAIETGEPIEGFPQTPSEIARLSSPQVNAILRALELDTSGTIEAKRQRLRLCIGLKATPV